MNAYIQNVSYCKRSIRNIKTYQKECKCCIRFLLTHLNERAYKTLVMAIKRIKQIKTLGSFNNPIKSKCILSECLVKTFFLARKHWFSKAAFHKINKQTLL